MPLPWWLPLLVDKQFRSARGKLSHEEIWVVETTTYIIMGLCCVALTVVFPAVIIIEVRWNLNGSWLMQLAVISLLALCIPIGRCLCVWLNPAFARQADENAGLRLMTGKHPST